MDSNTKPIPKLNDQLRPVKRWSGGVEVGVNPVTRWYGVRLGERKKKPHHPRRRTNKQTTIATHSADNPSEISDAGVRGQGLLVLNVASGFRWDAPRRVILRIESAT